MLLPLILSFLFVDMFTSVSAVSPVFSPALPNFRFVGEASPAGVVGPLGELRFFKKREVSFPKEKIFGRNRPEATELMFFNKKRGRKMPDFFENGNRFEVFKKRLPQQKKEGRTIKGLVERRGDREVVRKVHRGEREAVGRVRREARLIKDPRFIF